jgi:hypothetical protein
MNATILIMLVAMVITTSVASRRVLMAVPAKS